MQKKIKPFYRLNLPHFQPAGAIFFVTFRLQDSIPKARLAKLKLGHEENIEKLKSQNTKLSKTLIQKEKNQFFLKYDQLLDTIQSGPHHLKVPEIAQIVKNELHRFDGKSYDLMAYCIMSNHVHILIDSSIQLPEDLKTIAFEDIKFTPLQNIMKRIKGPSAVYANRLLKIEGRFWQRESYDRVIRNHKELENTIGYILNNPVNAGIVKEWNEYSFSYYKYEDQ